MAGKPKPYKKVAGKKPVAKMGSRTKRGTGARAGYRTGRRPLG